MSKQKRGSQSKGQRAKRDKAYQASLQSEAHQHAQVALGRARALLVTLSAFAGKVPATPSEVVKRRVEMRGVCNDIVRLRQALQDALGWAFRANPTLLPKPAQPSGDAAPGGGPAWIIQTGQTKKKGSWADSRHRKS